MALGFVIFKTHDSGRADIFDVLLLTLVVIF